MATDFETIASEQFGIIANAHPLPGYSDSNARLEAEDGRSYTLKVSPAGTDPEVLDLQNRVLETLGRPKDGGLRDDLRSRATGDPG